MAKILIVDDSEMLRVEIKELLENMGHEVIEGKDGSDGYRQAEANQPLDLIVSDYNMPGLDGLSMLKKIRSVSGLEKTPVAMLTTESSSELRTMGKSLGVVVWCIKPIDNEQFEKTISIVLEKFSKAS
jgi:two-component system chemotaxis response regulator CheY